MIENTIDELRAARQTANTVYMKFTENNDMFSTYAFCFFEGEDAKYYHSRIKKHFSNNFICYTAGNKKEVIKLMNKIQSDNLYDNVVKMFFVDNDFDESLSGSSSDLYETPCYSIENLYAQKECFEDIIQSEFGINRAHLDYQKCIGDFESRFEEFMDEIKEFNALALLRRKKTESNSDVKFGDIKTNHLLSISINEIAKASKYSAIVEDIKTKLDITQDELIEGIKILQQEKKSVLKYRGKNQLDFFCIILAQLKALNGNGSYFSEKHNCVKLNITGNRLSELSQYALTPECLDKFLDDHLQMLVS